jgi:xanthine dehydrogenase accessory factor
MSTRIDELSRTGVPFVQATVVRAQDPSSARPGDRAIVLADGSMEGFVGGHCAAGSVRTAALDVLRSGESVLLRVLPEPGAFPESPGASIVVNPCLSGGALEIYLEPTFARPVVQIVGRSPTADALADLAGVLDLVVDRSDGDADPRAATAVIVSSHGGDEGSAVRRALDAGVGFVGVVCSQTRGAAILAELDLPDDLAARVHTHVGLDIGAKTPAEVALSILGEVVRAVRLDGLGPADAPRATTRPAEAVDPVCGMTVTVGPDTIRAEVGGVVHWFCNPGCRSRFLEMHVS